MAEPKTKPTKQSARAFLEAIEPEEKRKDSLALLKVFQAATGKKPVMWGTNIVGFGVYHYKSGRSAQESDWPLVAFSPRKQALTLYILSSGANNSLLKTLGKYKASGGCLHIKRLADVDVKVLSNLISDAYRRMQKKWSVA